MPAPKAAAEPTPKRTPGELHREAEQLLDVGARRLAERLGGDYVAGLHAFMATPEGQQLYRIYSETPATEPARFSQPAAAEATWAEIEQLGRQKVAAGECKSLAEATTKVLSEQPELYNR